MLNHLSNFPNSIFLQFRSNNGVVSWKQGYATEANLAEWGDIMHLPPLADLNKKKISGESILVFNKVITRVIAIVWTR